MIPDQKVLFDTFLHVLDIVGTFVFAMSGATVGVRHKLDLFGVLVLSFVAATFGGITRDVIIGAIPPAAINDWRYLTVSIAAGLLTFYRFPLTARLANPAQVFDAAGLALVAVAGAGKALAYHLGPTAAILLGMVTGIGGGIVRDVLVREVPVVFRTELYAVTAFAGAFTFVAGTYVGVPSNIAAGAGAILCFGLRLAAIKYRLKLPVSPGET